MASHPYSGRNASTTSTDIRNEDSRPYPDRLVLPPISYSGERQPNSSKYSAEGPAVTLPAIQSPQYSQPFNPYQSTSERPSRLTHLQDDAHAYPPALPYEFLAGKSAGQEPSRQMRKIGQRRETPDEAYRADRKSGAAPPRPYIQTRPIIRQSSPVSTLDPSTRTIEPDSYRDPENRLPEGDSTRDLKKRPSTGALPRSKEQKTREKHSVLPISDLIRVDSSNSEATYTISMRQQPIAARACGFGERDRRVIDPPPILELKIEEPGATADELKGRLRYPYYVVHCSLWNAEHDIDNSAMDDVGDRRNQQRRLMGTLVASPFVGKDENNVEGCFFCFPDLSCRTTGRYRLKFVLMVLDPNAMKTGNKVPFASSVISDVVTVYAAKDFPGMQSSTPLTRKLKEQGCLISVKKGIEKIGEKPGDGKSLRGESDDDEGVKRDGKPSRSKKN